MDQPQRPPHGLPQRGIGRAHEPRRRHSAVASGAFVSGFAYAGDPIDAHAEERYWRDAYVTRPYAYDLGWDDIGPAYRYGWEMRAHHPERRFEAIELELARDWLRARGPSMLTWERARHAVRDAWDRIERSYPRR